jgi:hypothetical protein
MRLHIACDFERVLRALKVGGLPFFFSLHVWSSFCEFDAPTVAVERYINVAMRSLTLAFAALAIVPTVLAVPASQAVSRNARCGASFGLTCRGSSYGNCCSQYGYCGSTSSYCGDGCQTGYGSCNSIPAPSISQNGRCGQDFGGATCQGSRYGNCCR